MPNLKNKTKFTGSSVVKNSGWLEKYGNGGTGTEVKPGDVKYIPMYEGNFTPSYSEKKLADWSKENFNDYLYDISINKAAPNKEVLDLINKENAFYKPYEDVNTPYEVIKKDPKFKEFDILNKFNNIRNSNSEKFLNDYSEYSDLNQHLNEVRNRYKINQGSISKNKTKQDYFNYLDSPYYQATAKKMWGDEAGQYIDNQKNRVQNTPIKTFDDMSSIEKISYLRDPSYLAAYNNASKEIWNPNGNPQASLHELSHATDANLDFPSDAFETTWSERSDGSRINVGMNSLNPKYTIEDLKKIKSSAPGFSKWDERFPDYTDGKPSPYLKRGTEVRARINALRTQMSKDGFDWNTKSGPNILEYLKKQTDPLLKQQGQELDHLKEDELLDLFQNYASVNNVKNLPTAKYGGWLEQYGDGGLKSVTGPAPKFDAKTETEGKRIASGYNNANKQNAQISQTRNWSQADQEHSDRVKARINNPASDVGILAANMASNLTRFRNLTPEEIARVTDNVGETVNLSSGIATDALTNELVGYGATKAIPLVSKSAKSAGKYLTEETALKNAYKANPLANKEVPLNKLYHKTNNPNLSLDEIDLLRLGKSQSKKRHLNMLESERPSGFYTSDEAFYRFMGGKSKFSFDFPANAKIKDLKLEGRITDRISQNELKELQKEGYDLIRGENMIGQTEYIPLNKSKISNWNFEGTSGESNVIPGAADESVFDHLKHLENQRFETTNPHWLKGFPKKEMAGSLNKINTKKMWRIENPNIKFNPSKVANENAQQEHVGNWFSDDINYVSDYLRKNQKVPGSRLAEVNVPESELSKYHISNYPDMKDVEPRNWLIPDAFNRNYTDLSHLTISGGNLSKIKENQNYIKELVNKKIAEKKYGGIVKTLQNKQDNSQWLEKYGL